MKTSPFRKKVVVRHLPPTITKEKFMEQVDARFSGLYTWVSFFPGNSSQKKSQSSSRAYIDFKKPEDVIDFSDFFNGHVFVNEKGTQFKSIVEYAPSQHIPKPWSKKDGREGSIYKDPEFMEFLEFIAKPVENLPSADIQLERREAERSGAIKESPIIITPLMDFIRQRRAAKSGSQRSLPNRKLFRKAAGFSSESSRHGSDRKKSSTTKYVLKDITKSTGRVDKPACIQIARRYDQVQSNKSVMILAAPGAEVAEGPKGPSGAGDTGKKNILLLKGKEKGIPHSGHTSAVKDSLGSAIDKSNQPSILLKKDARPSKPSQSPDQQNQESNIDRNRRPPRPHNVQSSWKETIGAREGKIIANDWHSFLNEKQGKQVRNRDRPDRVVWPPLPRSDGSHASDESLSSATTHSTKFQSDFGEGYHGEIKADVTRGEEGKSVGNGNNGRYLFDNGFHKYNGRRGVVYNVKDADAASLAIEGKLLKRSVAYSSHEKQVWVQKSGSGS